MILDLWFSCFDVVGYLFRDLVWVWLVCYLWLWGSWLRFVHFHVLFLGVCWVVLLYAFVGWCCDLSLNYWCYCLICFWVWLIACYVRLELDYRFVCSFDLFMLLCCLLGYIVLRLLFGLWYFVILCLFWFLFCLLDYFVFKFVSVWINLLF